ncbi:MAG: hypothetical protein WAL20_17880, partial [Rhodomicrobium sp.]
RLPHFDIYMAAYMVSLKTGASSRGQLLAPIFFCRWQTPISAKEMSSRKGASSIRDRNELKRLPFCDPGPRFD